MWLLQGSIRAAGEGDSSGKCEEGGCQGKQVLAITLHTSHIPTEATMDVPVGLLKKKVFFI